MKKTRIGAQDQLISLISVLVRVCFACSVMAYSQYDDLCHAYMLITAIALKRRTAASYRMKGRVLPWLLGQAKLQWRRNRPCLDCL